MKCFGITDKGKVRSENQDSYLIEALPEKRGAVFVLCDGMGGAKAGDLASRLSCKAFAASVFSALTSPNTLSVSYEKLLKNSSDEANGVVNEYSRFGKDYNGMGTTLVGGVLLKRRAYLVNIGDSRAYMLDKSGIRQITRDHSYVEELIEMGAISREEAKNHPRRNVITRALGVDKRVDADYFEVSLRKGDCLLLCSDGLSNTVSASEMFVSYKMKKNPDKICKELMKLALNRGARDNVTVVALVI